MFKSGIKRIFNSIGYDIVRKNQRSIYDLRHTIDAGLEHIKSVGYYPELVIDVGAADGTPPLQKSFQNAFFFWIEPLKEFEPSLKKLEQSLRGQYVITAVGKNEGKVILNVHKDLHGSTLFKETDGESADGAPRQIPVTTLNSLAANYNWQQYKKIILKVDVQGYELEVLKGAGDIFEQLDLIILEVSLFRFLQQAPDLYEVLEYMKSIGFVVYDIVGGINRPADYALAQKDLFFVKENGFFRRSHGWAG